MQPFADQPFVRDGAPLLAAHGLVRRGSNGESLLDCVEFGLSEGERWAISGPSGSGKTLLLRALALLDPSTGGEVRWLGEPIGATRIPLFRRHIAYLPQRPALLDCTVADNLAYPYRFAAHRNGSYDPERIEAWLAALGRDPAFADKSARELSGGEAQIAALLRTLQFDPQVLLLDEPTAALDNANALAVERLLKGWIEEGQKRRSYIWISHDPEQAKRVADRAVTMRAGHIENRI